MQAHKEPKEKKATLLSKEILAAIDAAEPYGDGLGITLDEAHELARKRTKAWMSANPKPRAA